MGDIPLPAQRIEKLVPVRAEGGLQKSVGIVDARVDYLAVAAARFLTEAGVFLNDEYPFMVG
jgi:hypothetical protein